MQVHTRRSTLCTALAGLDHVYVGNVTVFRLYQTLFVRSIIYLFVLGRTLSIPQLPFAIVCHTFLSSLTMRPLRSWIPFSKITFLFEHRASLVSQN